MALCHLMVHFVFLQAIREAPLEGYPGPGGGELVNKSCGSPELTVGFG